MSDNADVTETIKSLAPTEIDEVETAIGHVTIANGPVLLGCVLLMSKRRLIMFWSYTTKKITLTSSLLTTTSSVVSCLT